jgi:predicted dehydrogenase
MKLAILGSGFIARFYADALVGHRRKDEIVTVYSRTLENAKKFADDYKVPNYTDSIEECV